MEVSAPEGTVPMLHATLHWGLTADKFEGLLSSLRSVGYSGSLQLRAWLPEELDLSKGFASICECLLDLTACSGEGAGEERQTAKRLLGEAGFELLRGSYFDRYSYAGRMAKELSESIGRMAQSATQLQELVDAASERISEFREALRPARNWKGSEEINWRLAGEAFEQAYADRSNWEELKVGFDAMWWHCSMRDILRLGEQAAGMQQHGHWPQLDMLEACARELLQRPALRSELLERQLVDVLVFLENLAFAQTVRWEQRSGNPSYPDELGPTPAPSVRKALWKSVRSVALEASLLLGTWLLATVIATGNTLAIWAFFLAGTAFRWSIKKLERLRPGVAASTQEQAEDLLADMVRVASLFKHVNFHRGLVWRELARLTSRGAVYSPFVFELLERDQAAIPR